MSEEQRGQAEGSGARSGRGRGSRPAAPFEPLGDSGIYIRGNGSIVSFVAPES